ncbi:ATP synthase subunit I [Sporomusa malonica]|uniref:ATP synthase I chain n=2 Tax=Sporomusa malonica TaxID=112901 RepID=A0A1W2EGR6_9FIRM|nr:ATP synthase subunit I [Sporomusa malonica]SMD08889.1 ATP synthase I chain [Sporomusa malonica]
MKNYEFKVRNMLAQIAMFGVVFCPIAYFYYTVQVTTGLLIGLVTGSIYFLYLYRQIENVKVLSKQQAVEHIRGGSIIRLGAMVLVLVVISHVFKVNVLAFVVGFFTMPVFLFINGMLLVAKQVEDAKKI